MSETFIAPAGAMQFEVDNVLHERHPPAIGCHLWIVSTEEKPSGLMPGCNCKQFYLVVKVEHPDLQRFNGRCMVCRCMGRIIE
jgi:hypothetical protein